MNGEAKEMIRAVWGYLSSSPASEPHSLEQHNRAAAALTVLTSDFTSMVTGNLRAFLTVTTALLRHALPLVSPCCLLLDTFFSFRCPEMSLKRPLIDGTFLTKASLYSLWFPGLHFWPLSKMGATLACPHSQDTSTNPNSKGIFQRISINLPL